MQANDGYLYGVTNDGIYKLSLAGTVTIPAVMAGLVPNTLVQASDGNFYGTTEHGGPVGLGTVFRMTPAGTVTTLYKFGTLPTDGGTPIAGLIQASDSNLYGTTDKTIFRVTLGGVLTTLYTFGTQSTDGFSPIGQLVQGTDHNLYGVT